VKKPTKFRISTHKKTGTERLQIEIFVHPAQDIGGKRYKIGRYTDPLPWRRVGPVPRRWPEYFFEKRAKCR
jgi:hypothetical protein